MGMLIVERLHFKHQTSYCAEPNAQITGKHRGPLYILKMNY